MAPEVERAIDSLKTFPFCGRGMSVFFVLVLWVVRSPLAAAEGSRSIEILCPDGYLPGVPVLVRVELRNADGAVARDVWDAEAVLSAEGTAPAPSPDRVKLWNGIGCALVTLGGTGDVTLTASVGGLQASRTLKSLAGEPIQTVQGTLPATLTEWSGVVHVQGNVTVPDGGTLRILPGTLVLIEGVSTGEGQPGECKTPAETPAQCGTTILVNGTLESLGTEERPVTITARESSKAWGEIQHSGSDPSLYRHTFITRGGNSRRGGHTGTGPIIRSGGGSRIRFEHSVLAFTAGKSMQVSDSDLEFYDCVLARSTMGPEISGTSLVFERTWAFELYGTDDNDGIYLHDQKAGQTIALRGSVFASGDDDGIDTLGSDVTIEDCIVRDFDGPDADAKGISIFRGSADISRCLVSDNQVGIAAKGDGSGGAEVWIDRTTVAGNRVAIYAQDKNNEPDLEILFSIRNSILRAEETVKTDYPPEQIAIDFSGLSHSWTGAGNIVADPLFMAPASGDYRLQTDSPCIDSGDPDSAQDPDGTRADMGVFPYKHSAPEPSFVRGRVNDDATVDLADAVAILLHMFASLSIGCADAADLTDDGALDVADAIRLLAYLFQEGAPPAAPAETCGADATSDPLGCAVSPTCI